MEPHKRANRINLQGPLEEYIEFFETLTPRSLRLIGKVVDPNIQFSDPFNSVIGVDKVVQVFEKMFDDVDDPKSRVLDYAWGRDNNTAYLRWIFTYKIKSKHFEIEGMTEVKFSGQGKVMSHIDYWDAGKNVYEHVPVVKNIIRFVKKHLEI